VKSKSSRIVAAILAVLAITYVVPLPIYGAFSALGVVEMPEDVSPVQFMLSVFVMKIGVSLAFVLLYRRTAPTLGGRWWSYAGIWWLMFALVEAGQAIGPAYSGAEAVAGIIAESIYFPLSSLVVSRLLGAKHDAP
jgi:hypothetical protein